MKTRILSLLLVVSMLLTMTVVVSHAAEESTPVQACGGDHTGWTPFSEGIATKDGQTGSAMILLSGNYYLDKDISTSSTIYILGDVKICLNGHTIKNTNANNTGGQLTTYSAHQEISPDSDTRNITLCDCQGTGAITYAPASVGTDSAANAIRVMAGKGASTTVIQGGTISNFSGSGIEFAETSATSSLTIEGGTITGNGTNKKDDGGGINFKGGTLTINGGTISNNIGVTNGGGVFVNQAATTTTIGGSAVFTGNSATNGGAVRVDQGTMIINGGTFSNNTARYGTVYQRSGDLVVNGGQFTNNTLNDPNGWSGSIFMNISSAGGSTAIKGGTSSGNLHGLYFFATPSSGYTADIIGGTFEDCAYNPDAGKVSVLPTLSGGRFGAEPSGTLADGCVMVNDGAGDGYPYLVGKGYAVTLEHSQVGSITVTPTATLDSSTVIPAGATVTVQAVPAGGYILDRILLDSSLLDGSTFTMPERAVTVSAEYSIDPNNPTEYVLLEDDFNDYTVGAFDCTHALTKGYSEVKVADSTATIAAEADDATNNYFVATPGVGENYRYYLAYHTNLRTDYPYTHEFDIRLPGAETPDGDTSIRFGTKQGESFAGGALRLVINNSSKQIYLLNADADSTDICYHLLTDGTFSAGSGEKVSTDPNAVTVNSDEWWHIKAVVIPTTGSITVTAGPRDSETSYTATFEVGAPIEIVRGSAGYLDVRGNLDEAGGSTVQHIDNLRLCAYDVYGVVLNDATGGSLQVDKPYGTLGETVTVTANNDVNYILDTMTANGTDITATGTFELLALTEGNVVSATFKACPHANQEEIPTVAPTCVSTGHSGGTKCSDCNAVIVEPTIIDADPSVSVSVDTYKESSTVPALDGVVFGGWYSDAGLTTPYLLSTGSAYAKFVNRAVLSVKYQISTDTTADSPSTDLRLVTTVDDLNYQRVGFAITIGGVTKNVSSSLVFEAIVAETGGVPYTKLPTVFDTQSNYFMTFTITDIPSSAFGQTITVVPYWVTLDGTTVNGASKSFTINTAIAAL